MSSGRSLPHINLGVQGGIQGDSHNPENISNASTEKCLENVELEFEKYVDDVGSWPKSRDVATTVSMIRAPQASGAPTCLQEQLQKTSERPTNQIPHVLNRRYIQRISRQRKKLCMLGSTEVSNSLCSMWACSILMKDSSRDALKEGNDFGL
ncbi:hypothetical protein TNCV_2089011 [Trichonephila clavipes]|nr:hypothetical protein TNCV_2089011 [Trichonephila clavipes]